MQVCGQFIKEIVYNVYSSLDHDFDEHVYIVTGRLKKI